MTTDYRFGTAHVQASQRRLFVADEDTRIGARAFDLLLVLIERRERVVSKNELLEHVWPGLVVEENNVPVQIGSLRRLLGPHVIATVPGRGYQFVAVLQGTAAPEVSPTLRSEPDTLDTGLGNDGSDPTRQVRSNTLGNLPMQVAALYGRDQDLAALRHAIEDRPVVSLVGSGGIGKSALALALAQQLRGAFQDGVWLVEFAPVSDPALVASTVGIALGVSLGGEAQIDALANALSRRNLLIVLDNCEHLLAGVAELTAALCRSGPGLRMLVTSQEPLRLAQEGVYRLDGLALPAEADVESARHAGAVALFEARARHAQPRFEVNADNVATVVDICRHLDGIALAIELAAARVALLGVEGLRARLDERFRVLTGGSRLALRRHQTLRAALEWSYGLLTLDEQRVLRRLGVFAGSFPLQGAQQVVQDTGIDEWAALDHLGALVDKSLIVVDAGDPPRYRLLETTRAFALEKLHEAGETDATLQRHAQAVLAIFEASSDDEFALAEQARLQRYLPDLDNARAALDWACTATGDRALHVALAGALGWIWVAAGLRPEGFRRTRAAIAAMGPDTAPRLEARLRRAWPGLAHPTVGPEELESISRAIQIYRQIGDLRSLYVALSIQARFMPYCGQMEQAELALREADELFDPTWPVAIRAWWLQACANLRDVQGRFEEAMAVLEAMCELAVDLDDKRLLVKSLINLEQSAAALGRLEESISRSRELMALIQQHPSIRSGNESFVLKNFYMSLVRSGRLDEAVEVAHSAYLIMDKVGRGWEMLEPCALAAAKRGRVRDAARLFGRVCLLFASSDVVRDPVELQLRDDLVVLLERSLSGEELARYMKAGETLSDEAAVEIGLRS